MPDSLDNLEWQMAVEEALDEAGDGLGLTDRQAEILVRIRCSVKAVRWQPPDTNGGAWPDKVTIIGRQGSRLLFVVPRARAFGVGDETSPAFVGRSRLYPSLARALFEFSHTPVN